MNDLAYLTVAEASSRIRARALSPVELTRALLDRIDALDSSYNAFISVTANIAMAQARAAEEEIARGKYRGPLHGVPYAVKDLFDVAGTRTSCHSKLRSEHRAQTDAFAVRRLREAGAVLVGKLALHEFATGGPAFDLPFPPARNPWNRDLHPGGSSSGSGTAVALGMVPAALGTDTGGSVRNPATCCGIVGLKPTYGAVSRSGVFPLAFSLDHVGPLTRTVEDNAIVYQAIAGRDADDPGSAARAVPDCLGDLHAGVKGLRIGIVEHFYREDYSAHPEQVRAIEEAAATLRDLGADVRPLRVRPLQDWVDCNRTILQAEAYAIHQRDLQERPEDFAAITRAKILPGGFIPASEYIKAQQWRRVLTQEFAEAMRGCDAVITLSSLDLPCRIDDPETVAKTYDRQCRMVFNVTGMPAIAVPTGFTPDNVPLGMQIAARSFDEPTVFRVAHAYCEAAGFSAMRPPVAPAMHPVAAQ